MNPTKAGRKRKSLVGNARWAAYASAGAASTFVCAESADAAIHHVNVGQSFGGGSAGTAFAFPLDQPGDQFSLGWFPLSSGGGFAGFAVQGLVSHGFVGSAAGAFRYPFKLAAGQPIAAGPFVQQNGSFFATLAYGPGFTHSHWLAGGTTGFVGFRFNGGAGVEYGWARIQLDSGPDQNDFTLVDYAWGDVGDVFNAGDLTVTAVPEPATFAVGLLAMGAVGVTALRRRRAAEKQAASS